MLVEGTRLSGGHAHWMPEGRDDPVVPKLTRDVCNVEFSCLLLEIDGRKLLT